MTFNQIALKIFKANLRRYLLYFLCNSFTIMVFFTYSTIYTNKEFMNSPNISGTTNIIAPGVIIILFSIFFIFYTQSSFIKFRKSEFGLFMVLGMTNQNIQRIMIFENALIAIFSLLAGLASGTIFSRLFYLLTIKIINVRGIPFSISIESYLYTIIFFAVIYCLVIIKGFIDSFWYEIMSLLKASRKKDKNFMNSPIWGAVGILLIGIAFFDMKYNFNSKNSIVLVRSMMVCFLGLYLFISSIVWLISKIINFKQNNVCKNILYFITKPGLTILCNEDLNTNLGTHIKVEKGYYVSLFQVVKDDGHDHNMSEINSLNIEINNHNYNYKPKGKITEILFNNIPILNNGYYVILNVHDYQSIKANAQSSGDLGDIKLMNFKDWTKTGDILKELQNKLEIYNTKNTKLFYDNISEDIKMFKPVSRIGDYSDSIQAGSFLLFLFSFMGILFFVSSTVIMHFKLLSEYEIEKIKYKKLYKIGITDSEVSRILTKELRVLFFLPIIMATLIAAFYNYSLTLIPEEGMISLRYSLIIGLIYLFFQMVFYLIYKRIYVGKLIRDIEK